MNKLWSVIGIIALLVFTVACKKDLSTEEQLEKDRQDILEYIEGRGLNAKETSEGIFYVIEHEGTGAHPNESNDVRVRYKGYDLKDKVFDESPEEGIVFNLQNVITGWTKGIPKFKEGGKGKLLIPSSLGYGEKGASTIPPNTVLIFDVELLNIEN